MIWIFVLIPVAITASTYACLWLSIVIHEIGHAIVGMLCGSKILIISIGNPDTPSISTRLSKNGPLLQLSPHLGGGVMFDDLGSIATRAVIITAGPAVNFVFAAAAFIALDINFGSVAQLLYTLFWISFIVANLASTLQIVSCHPGSDGYALRAVLRAIASQNRSKQ